MVSCSSVGYGGIGQRCRSEGYNSREYVGSCAANSLGEYDGSCAADSMDEYHGPGATHTLELVSGNSP